MRHYLTRTLFDYWAGLMHESGLPYRTAIDPKEFKPVLPHTFILERIDSEHIIYRLAGTELCSSYGREFRDQNFLQMWQDNQRRSMRMLIDQVVTLRCAGLVHFHALTLGQARYACEAIILPLLDGYHQPSRLIGAMLPLEPLSDIGDKKLVKNDVKAIELLDDDGIVSIPTAAASVLKGETPSYLRLVHSQNS